MLLTQLGPNIATWTLQDTLAFSRAGQQDYVIEIDENDEATIIFGDGNFGAIHSQWIADCGDLPRGRRRGR
ncbi:MAG: hypothetical protein WDO73_04475 [Ignavibacteriota bacterium]